MLSARGRLQSDGISTSAQTATGPPPAEGLRKHVGNRFTSAIGLTRVENRRHRLQAGQRRAGIVAGCSAGSVVRVKIAPRATVMSHRTASSKVPLLGLWKRFVASFGPDRPKQSRMSLRASV